MNEFEWMNEIKKLLIITDQRPALVYDEQKTQVHNEHTSIEETQQQKNTKDKPT